MRVLSLEADGYKNLRNISLSAHPSLNLILGNNAQGKTNLLESIWTCTGCRSFRGSKERDLIHLKMPAMHLKLRFQDKRRVQEIEMRMQRAEGRQKKILFNQVPVVGGSKLFSQFQCVTFAPDDREYIRGGPEKRRALMDLGGSQITPAMLGCLKRFDQLTAQRNAVLKQIHLGAASKQDLEDWDLQLSLHGSLLTCLRYAYLKQLAAVCTDLYTVITAGKEKLSVSYRSNIFRNSEIPERPTREMQMTYLEHLVRSRDDDIRLGFTAKGAGRDDFACKIGGLSVRDFGSQGQQKSTALVLKLAQASVFYEKKEETPIILLDDVMGELDVTRQNLVYSLIRDMQVFLTACNSDTLGQAREKQNAGECAVFYMENGSVSAAS